MQILELKAYLKHNPRMRVFPFVTLSELENKLLVFPVGANNFQADILYGYNYSSLLTCAICEVYTQNGFFFFFFNLNVGVGMPDVPKPRLW